MRTVTLLALIISALSFNVVAQPSAVVHQQLYYRFTRNYLDASKSNADQPLIAFFVATGKTFQLGNDTTLRLFKEVEKLNPEMGDSMLIVRVMVPVIHQFLDSNYLSSVCPAGYERAQEAMMNYSNYLCHCIPEEQENIRRFDTSAKLVDAIGACRRAIRFNDSLKNLLVDGLSNYGISGALLEPCAGAFVFSHCAHLRNTLTQICCELVLNEYRFQKTKALAYLNRYLDAGLRAGRPRAEFRAIFDNEQASLAFDQASFWTGPELRRPYWQKVISYIEMHNYGHELMVTYLIDDAKKPSFLLQAIYGVKWSLGNFKVTTVYVTNGKRIRDQELILEGVKKMKARMSE